MARYAEHLEDEETDKETYPYLILSNQITKAVKYFMKRKEFEQAFLISAMKNMGYLVEKDIDDIEYEYHDEQDGN